MDATQRLLCGGDLFNPILSMGLQASLILSVSHLIQLAIKPIGQPATIAQLFAGLLLGQSGVAKINAINNYFFQASSADYYEVMAFFGRISFVFLIGLELDVAFLKRQLHAAATVAYAGAFLCLIFAGAISYPIFVYLVKDPNCKKGPCHFEAFVLVLMVSVANSASPLVIRMAAELNLGTSDFGRLAIGAALVNDISCTVFGVVVSKVLNPEQYSIWSWIFSLVVTGMVSLALRYLANWLNGVNRNYKYLRNAPLACVLLIVVLTAGVSEIMGENSILTSFLLGLLFPKEGKTARTLSIKLSYALYTFLLPIYFGYTGFLANLSVLREPQEALAVLNVVFLSVAGKILGTLAACHRLKIPMNKGVILALMLNMKGHYDFLILGKAKVRMVNGLKLWQGEFFEMMLVTIILNSLLSGVIVAFVVSRDSMTFGYRPVALEWQNMEGELRVLSCVHGPRHVPSLVRLVGVLSWSRDFPVAAYLMHLIELLPKKKTSNKLIMYNQLEDDELSDDEAYGGNDILEINEAVDAFVAETGIFINLVKAVAPPASIYQEVCNGAEDVRASIVLIPFHKHQRIDGKMEAGKEGLRTTNQRVLRHVPCTVGILVDRGCFGPSQAPSCSGMQHVAVLFFGGPDDREALSFSKRIGMHHHVNLAVIRFVLATSRNKSEKINISCQGNEQILMAMPSRGAEDEADDAFLEDFYNRYVTSGKVGYVEKYVRNGAQTVAALRDIGDMYQLFIVGKGGQRNSPLTTGMSDWEECPELGTVGDLLASSEYDTNSSVLVIQQRRPLTD